MASWSISSSSQNDFPASLRQASEGGREGGGRFSSSPAEVCVCGISFLLAALPPCVVADISERRQQTPKETHRSFSERENSRYEVNKIRLQAQ